jgi:diguanylate cyclase (GGDEF)-like protein
VTTGVAAYTWLCPNELERERLLTTVRWIRPARTALFVILSAIAVGSTSRYGWGPVLPLAVAAIGSTYLYRELERRRSPEYWAGAGWLLTQLMLGVVVAMTGGPRSPVMPWLAIAIVSLVALFSLRGMFVGMTFLFAMLVALTFGLDPHGVAADPTPFLVAIGLLGSVAVFAAALMRSDLAHRDHDKLTGLPNHAMFAAQLRQALARRERSGGQISLLAVDLDGFGLANDSLGPFAGDQLLRQAATRVSLAARSAELVARRSADEFLILVTELEEGHSGGAGEARWRPPKPGADEIARAVQSALSHPLHVADEDVYLGACVGIAVLAEREHAPADASTVERLLLQAQHALSAARTAGPGSLTVYDPARPSSIARLSLITRLRRAIDREEFVVHYQPTVNLRTGAVAGVEALLRWQDPDRGLIGPEEFIEVAEETGMILPIGTWILDEVCRQANAWEQLGLDLTVAFNLSPRQLWQPELVPRILASIDSAGALPQRLVFEITETAALRDPALTSLVFAQLTQHGASLAIDDFGVGLSSLSRLRTIPADVLKIDRSFIADLGTTRRGAVMVQTIIQLAHNLGMRPLAEGIETEAQRRFLVENGCVHGQGFLFSGALPAAEIPSFYLRSQPAASEVARHPGGGDPARVVGRRAQDQHLGWDPLEQPQQVVLVHAGAGELVGRDDDAVEVLLGEQVAQRVAV